MTARDDIFRRVRAALGRDDSNHAAVRQAVDASCLARVQGPRVRLDPALYATRFKQCSQALSSTVDEVRTLAEVPAAVMRYLQARCLANEAVIWPAMVGLGWTEAGVRVEARAPNGNDKVGITGCFCAIAETGTLMTLSGPETIPSTSLLPETHIAVVPYSRIVAGMEEGWTLLRQEHGSLPRAVNFISGPSRTADIEQTIVLGAHGPSRVHLIMVCEA